MGSGRLPKSFAGIDKIEKISRMKGKDRMKGKEMIQLHSILTILNILAIPAKNLRVDLEGAADAAALGLPGLRRFSRRRAK